MAFELYYIFISGHFIIKIYFFWNQRFLEYLNQNRLQRFFSVWN